MKKYTFYFVIFDKKLKYVTDARTELEANNNFEKFVLSKVSIIKMESGPGSVKNSSDDIFKDKSTDFNSLFKNIFGNDIFNK